jgi:uncharacterized protein DUF1572
MSTSAADPRAAYLADIIRTFRNYKTLGERALAQTPDAALGAELDPNSNSIAIAVKHIGGNLRSRFRDFLTTDGEKPDRDRDREFETDAPPTRAEVMRWWDEGWAVVLGTLESLTPDDVMKTVRVRGEAFLVVEALNRAAAHIAYHVGQIVYLARHFAGPAWTTLSIPRGASAQARGEFKAKGLAR